MKILFLDESGDHNLVKIDPQYPVFVLAGVIADADYAEGELEAQFRDCKQELFGREDLVLHTADLTRNRGGFERLQDAAFRQRFYGALNDLVRGLQFQVVACAIRKDAHLARYGSTALDPYMLSLNVLVERFCFAIGPVEAGGTIVAEKRGNMLDRQLRLAWESLRTTGTRFMRAGRVRRCVEGLELRPKRENVAGLQLADLVATPIGRFVLGKPTHEDFRIIEAKFRRDARGEYRGRGLVVLPRTPSNE